MGVIVRMRVRCYFTFPGLGIEENLSAPLQSAGSSPRNWNVFFLFPQWKEDRTKETERRKDFSYILNLQKQVLSTRIRAKWNAPCNTQSKDHKNVKGLERPNTETSHWSVLPAPTELSWWWGNAFIFRSFQEEEGWCPDTAINLGMLPALGTVILSVQLTWWEMLAWVKNSWCHFGNSSRKLKF